MRVEEVMSEATCRDESDSVKDCARAMREESIGFLPICSQNGEPVGAITDRDLAIRVLADGRSADEEISTFMTRAVVSCRTGDDVKHAEQLMRDHRTSRIVVCDDDGKVAGVVSLADIADAESEAVAGQTLQEVKSDRPPAAH